MSYERFDRLPVWYFGQWREARERWLTEGLLPDADIASVTGMDPDWEAGMWDVHGTVVNHPISPERHVVLEETATYRVVRTSLGAVIKESKAGASIPQHIEHALKPTRESWARFKKFLDPSDPARRPAGWEKKAEALNGRTRVTTFLLGSLYGWPREWMGVEELSYLAYDDPALFEEIIAHLTDYFMALNRPTLARAQFDFAYIFEDCCFNTGPLLSPSLYRKFYDKYYRRLIEFCRGLGVPFVLLDSDGKTDDLIPCWLDSGVDIVFPIEVGTWKADPVALRRRFGKRLRMMGGVDKHVIPQGAAAIRAHLSPLKPLVEEGGFVPLPDHRIPPSCSLEQFKTYVGVFKEQFRF
jgi:uroporphyrinogen decarboxylase